jgi:putative endonuclease
MSNARLGRRYFAYLLGCADGTYYAGYTVDPLLRLAAHGRGRASKYTRGRGPFLLVAVWRCPTLGAALRVEQLLKGMTHESKGRLARGAPLARALLPEEARGLRRLRIRTRRAGAMRI